MWRLQIFIARLRGLIDKDSADRELQQEIDAHLELLAQDFARQGMSPEAAHQAARRQFGGIAQLRENHREARGIPWLDHCGRDLRLSFRLLHKNLAFSFVAIGVLALGIGTSTAVYSVAKGVVFAPLPFPKPDQLALMFEADSAELGQRFKPGTRNLSSVRPGTFEDWREQSRSFESMAAAQFTRPTIVRGGQSFVTNALRVGNGFFETLGVPAQLGRHFIPDDFAGDQKKIIVLADRLWRERYNADSDIVGREVIVDGASHRVVGVMPSGFLPTASGDDPQLWIPLHWDPAEKHSFVLWGYFIYARLKSGVTFAQAQTDMDIVATHMRAAHPRDFEGGAIVAPLEAYLFGGHDRLFALLLAAVGLVLFIACANVANLMLARGLKRQREFAVRSALGASRGAILGQVLIESFVLSIVAGILGAALSAALTRPTLALLPAGNLPRLDQVRIDLGVLIFTMSISIFAGVLFGIVPAMRAGRGDLSLTLRAGGRRSSSSRNERRLTDALMVAEIAVSLVLLSAAGLMARVFLKLLETDPGFRPDKTIALRLAIPSYRYGAYEEGGANLLRKGLYRRLDESVSSIAGVEVTGLTRKVPIRQFWNPDGISIEGRPPLIEKGEPKMMKRWGIPVHGMIDYQTVSPGYFAALRIPLVRGRFFDERDGPDAPLVALVNQAMVHKFFPNEDPIGRRIVVDRGTSFLRRMTIVGVVADVRLDGLDQRAQPEVLGAMAQLPSEDTWIVARASGDTESIGRALQKAVHDVDPEIGIVETSPMLRVIAESLWRERFSALLIGLFAGLAAIIAAAGVYAVVSHAVEQRTQEMGVRLALGANRRQITGTVLGHGFRVTLTSMAIGTVLVFALSRVVEPQAYPVGELPWIVASVVGLLSVMTLAACWIPARRALDLDPLEALRAE
jgi:putative ABC transport system permease protein